MKTVVALLGLSACLGLLAWLLPLYGDAGGVVPTRSASDVSVPQALKHRGVSWVAGHEVNEGHFSGIGEIGVNWMVQTPFGWQREHDSSRIVLATDGKGFWGETDAGLEETTRLAKSLGIKTLLKPHIWLTQAEEGKWRTHIEMPDEEHWRRWFASYATFILHYARLAERVGIEALCIGTELHQTAVQREADWRALIRRIREVYGGQLTYAANWYREFEEIRFWNDLDWIGVQAYFPLAAKSSPDLETLKRGWQPHLQALEQLSRLYGKPVLFTEIGYRATDDAAIEPWRWPAHKPEQATSADLEAQARCYEAFFQTVWQRDWFAGAYFWKWFPRVRDANSLLDKGFTPQNKPAEKVLKTWYLRSLEDGSSGAH